jgi:hypothetical protein
MEFENDVFVSYAHIDDQALIKGQSGWIRNLHRHLQVASNSCSEKKRGSGGNPTLPGK